MIKYYTRDKEDKHHLYKYDEESGEFYYMDHCWTGEGSWYKREFPSFSLIEIDENQAFDLANGNLEGTK